MRHTVISIWSLVKGKSHNRSPIRTTQCVSNAFAKLLANAACPSGEECTPSKVSATSEKKKTHPWAAGNLVR